MINNMNLVTRELIDIEINVNTTRLDDMIYAVASLPLKTTG